MSTNGTLIATSLAALLIATPTVAQTSDPAGIPRRLKPGDTVAVVELDGTESRGRLEQLSDTALEIRPIVPGTATNEYRTLETRKLISVAAIAGLDRVDPFGNNVELVYQHPDSFGTLPQRVRPEQVVRVIDTSGVKTLGRILDVSTSVLVISGRQENARDGSGRPRYEWTSAQTLTPAAVERIEKPAYLRDGALKGMAVALAIIGITAASTCGGSCYSEALVFTLALGAGVGAAAGVGIDAAFPPKRLYRAPK